MARLVEIFYPSQSLSPSLLHCSHFLYTLSLSLMLSSQPRSLSPFLSLVLHTFIAIWWHHFYSEESVKVLRIHDYWKCDTEYPQIICHSSRERERKRDNRWFNQKIICNNCSSSEDEKKGCVRIITLNVTDIQMRKHKWDLVESPFRHTCVLMNYSWISCTMSDLNRAETRFVVNMPL